jgi:hypothetical protein
MVSLGKYKNSSVNKSSGDFSSDDSNDTKTNDNMYYLGSTDVNTELFDNLPHVREAVEKGSSDITTPYSEHTSAGKMDDEKTFQKYLQGKEAGEDFYENGRAYLFITKPNLNLVVNPGAVQTGSTPSDTAKYNTLQNRFIQYIANNYPEIIQSLSYTADTNGTVPKFIPLLFNHYKSVSLEDHSFQESTYKETYRGYHLKLPTSAGASMAGGTIGVSYQELNIPLITYLHKVWFDYADGIKFGSLNVSPSTRSAKELDYMSALYYIAVAPDGETITFWAKYTGIVPSSVPYSAFGYNGSIEPVTLNCSYYYSYKEFLQPEILQDFNDVFDGGAYHPITAGAKDMEISTEPLDSFALNGSQDPNTLKDVTSKLGDSKLSNLERTNFTRAGVVKDGNDFKLKFYNTSSGTQ